MTPPTSVQHDVLAVIASLESSLLAVDALGAHIAAAHLDSSIQQLRLFAAEQAARDRDGEEISQPI